MAWGNGFKLSANIFRAALPADYKEKKQTYKNSEIFHTWASGNVFRGRSLNVFFENSTIYSYGHHFPAAKIFTNSKGEKLVLITTEKYSVTTSAHLYDIRRAVSHLEKIEVPDVTRPSAANLDALEFAAIDSLQTLLAGRGGDVIGRLTRLEKYCTFFGIKSSLPTMRELEKNGTTALFAELNKQAIKASAARAERIKLAQEKRKEEFKTLHADTIKELIEAFPAHLETWLAAPIAALEIKNMPSEDINPDDFISAAYERELMADEALRAAMIRRIESGRKVFGKIPWGEYKNVTVELTSEQEQAMRKRLAERHAAEVQAWQLGLINYVSSTAFYGNVTTPRSTYDLIRVRGERVETMRDAHVPLEDAIKLYKRIVAREAKQGERVGIYQFYSVSDENTRPRIVKIGCHTIDLDQAAQVLAPYLN